MPLVSGFSLGSPVSPTLAFWHCSLVTSLHPHRFSRSRCWELRATQIFRLHATPPSVVNFLSQPRCGGDPCFTDRHGPLDECGSTSMASGLGQHEVSMRTRFQLLQGKFIPIFKRRVMHVIHFLDWMIYMLRVLGVCPRITYREYRSNLILIGQTSKNISSPKDTPPIGKGELLEQVVELGKLAVNYSLSQPGPALNVVSMGSRDLLQANLQLVYDGLSQQEASVLQQVRDRSDLVQPGISARRAAGWFLRKLACHHPSPYSSPWQQDAGQPKIHHGALRMAKNFRNCSGCFQQLFLSKVPPYWEGVQLERYRAALARHSTTKHGSGKDSDRPVGDIGAGAKEAGNARIGVLGTSAVKKDGSIEDFVGVSAEEVDGAGKTRDISLEEEIGGEKSLAGNINPTLM
ncbi:hypothetical protein PR048_009328 [Dryococelus australis]|uniref:Uncharacterized protein n=1 Tax=Dryococelus australis TaxID=614101 RepID=A0ABQ9I0I4_9NEOP|nr:hypothetical protein PR048_009328 [Dryococelus australis]